MGDKVMDGLRSVAGAYFRPPSFGNREVSRVHKGQRPDRIPAVLTIFILLRLLSAQPAMADVQPCFGQAYADPKCPPAINSLTAVLVGVRSLGTNGFELHFHVGVSGSGVHSSSSAPLQVIVWAQVDDQGIEAIVTLTSDVPSNADGTCQTLSGDTCWIETVSVSNSAVKFWAIARQLSSGSPYCACSTETVTVPSPWTAGQAPGDLPPQASELGPMTCPLRLSDAINVTNGNVYVEQSDAQIPSDRGLPVAISRHYNSHGLAAGRLGPKWRMGLEDSLFVDSLSGDVTLTEATGRQVVFHHHLQQFGSGATIQYYASPYGIPYQLRIDSSRTSYLYQVTRPDNVTLVFDSTGLVDSIVDLAGNSIRLHYTGGRLDTVENSSTRRIVFSDSAGLVTQVKAVPGDTLLVSYEYQSNGLLKKVAYPDGAWEQFDYGTHAYDSLGLVTATTSDGSIRSWSYDSTGRAVHFHKGTDSSESVTITSRDTLANGCGGAPEVFRSTVKCGLNSLIATVEYAWSPDWSLRQVTSRDSSDCSRCGTSYTYDASGLPISVAYANGTTDEFTHDSRGNTTSRIIGANTPDRQWSLYTYDSLLNLPTLERQASVVTSTDAIDRTRYFYDLKGNLDSLMESGKLDDTSAFTYLTTFKYNTSGQDTLVDGPRTDVPDLIHYEYYANGDLFKRVLANGETTTFGPRNSLGRRTWVSGPNGDTTRYEFDPRGRLVQVTYASGSSDSTTVTMTYTVDGQVAAISNLGGNGWMLRHNAAGYLDSISDRSGAYIRYTFDAVGNPTSERIYQPDATLRKLETYVYDDKHQLTTISGPVGDTTRLSYDNVGNLDTLLDALLHPTVYSYDALSRLTATLEPSDIRTSIAYNGNNQVTIVVDPDSNGYVYRYDDRGRLSFDSSGATGFRAYRYDPADNLVLETNAAGDSNVFVYDSLNRVISRSYRDGQNVSYEYDGTDSGYFGSGRLYGENAPACTTRYLYDIRGRVAKEIRRALVCPVILTGDVNQDGYVSASDVLYLENYVLKGGPAPLPCIASGDVNCNGAVNGGDLLVLEAFVFEGGPPPCDVCPYIYAGTWSCDAGSDTTAYTYDRNDNLTSIRYSSGTEVFYDHDAADNVIRARSARAGVVDTLVKNVTYAPFGPAESWELKSGLTIRNHFDLRYLIDTLRADTGSIASYAYTYNVVGNITRMANLLSGLRTQDFLYDEVDRLIEAKSKDYSPDTLVTYKYSKNGNRTRAIGLHSWLMSRSDYFYVNNRLDSVNSGSAGFEKYRYDALGNTTQRGTGMDTTSYWYNDAGRMDSITGGSTATYRYDGQHRRLQKFIGADTLTYIPASTGQPLTEFRDDIWQSDWVYLNGKPLARLDASGGRLFFINDHLGTPLLLVDSLQAIQWSARWYPFGEIYYEYAPITNHIRFPGQWRDAESSLNYNWHRYYDPRSGRYIQADPNRSVRRSDLYAYVDADPMGLSDVLGLWVAAWNEGFRTISVIAEGGDNLAMLYRQLGLSPRDFARRFGIGNVRDYRVIENATQFEITDLVLRSRAFSETSLGLNCFSSTLAGTNLMSPEAPILGGLNLTSNLQDLFGAAIIESPAPGAIVTWMDRQGVTNHSAIYIIRGRDGTEFYFGRPGPDAELGIQTSRTTESVYRGLSKHYLKLR